MPGYAKRELDTVRALNIWSRRSLFSPHPRYGLQGHDSYSGRTIIASRPTRPYGHGLKGNARVTHVPRTLYTAWLKGQLVGAKVAWRCGGSCMAIAGAFSADAFVLTHEPVMPLCRICSVYSGGVTVTVIVNNH